MTAHGIRPALLLACVVLIAAGCGGGGGAYGGGGSSGGGSSGGGGSGGGPPADPTYTAGVYAAASTYASYCAVPRTGTDPYNQNKPYPDRQGSAVWEKFWIRSWINAYYLWYAQAPDLNPAAALYATPGDYFAADKAPDTVDHFHFTYPTAKWEALSQAGVSIGYGATFSLIAATPPRQVLVAYTEPASSGYPATSASVHLGRGASIIAVDGVDLVNSSDNASINTLNAGLFPASAGESHTFTVVDTPGAPSRVITMTSTSISEVPVQNYSTPTVLAGNVGYLLFNDHIATAEGELVTAIGALASAGVSDLVLDIRYNGGGYLDIASELAFMIAGPAQTAGKTFDRITFSDKYPSTDPITNQPITPTPFWSTTQGFVGPSGQALPSLNLTRVFVLTGGDTCSASEAIINGLNGANVQVILIGSQTCGKPYGFYPQDNCGTTYFSIEFKGVNQAGFGDYTDGFVAQNTTSATGVKIPGCSVADDFAHALGDPLEGRLAAALAYRTTGQAGCPTPPTGSGPPQSPLSVDGHVVKPEWLKNRILSHAH